MHISRRAHHIQASPIRKLKPYADKAKERGTHVYHLNIGDPDVPTPRPVLDALHAYNEPVIGYGPSQGFLDLRQSMTRYFGTYGIQLAADDINITTGGSEAIQFAFSAVGDPGDDILIPEPYYTNYNGYAAFADVRIVPITTKAEEGFHLPPIEQFEKLITPRTRALLLCSPNNPTGTIYTEEELEKAAWLVKKHDLFLIGDEVYKEFAYDGQKPISVLELPGLENRTIVVDSVSKRFSSCGARIGCLVTRNHDAMEALIKFAQARLCPPAVEQIGALAAYRMDPSYFNPIREEYQKRRDVMFDALNRIEGVLLKKPRGAFYMIAKLKVKNADDFAQWLLTDFSLDGGSVMIAPGDGFYGTPGRGLDEVRLAYVLNCGDIEKAMRIFQAALKTYCSNNPCS